MVTNVHTVFKQLQTAMVLQFEALQLTNFTANETREAKNNKLNAIGS
jgi:hypothetical protein